MATTYDTSQPAGGDSPTGADDEMRDTKKAIQERLDLDHYWELTGTVADDAGTGTHRKITFYSTIPDPGQASGKAHLYMKDDELYYQDADNSTLKLTDNGTLNITSSDLTGTLASDEFFSCVDDAGTGTVELIKANSSDVVIIAEAAQLAAAAVTGEDRAIADVGFVEAAVGAANWTPTSYAGEESITFPNGLIFKHGFIADGGATTTVVFGGTGTEDPFPNDIVSVAVTADLAASEGLNQVVNAYTVDHIIIKDTFTAHGYHWQAWGY